ncbi:hypothetical protein ILUMI_03592 [Ignelater luminosus]|uniref:Mini-chromosome maintenance complex-binding protein n=1 Tax=Ignelater luminosus TaxID=2038154 RepID=A0A8K0GKB5_IGNLU|nr:hypothetical protein ILUMI_03592 [Ignelater luminosus]
MEKKKILEEIKQRQLALEHEKQQKEIDTVKQEKLKAVEQIQEIAKKAIEKLSGNDEQNNVKHPPPSPNVVPEQHIKEAPVNVNLNPISNDQSPKQELNNNLNVNKNEEQKVNQPAVPQIGLNKKNLVPLPIAVSNNFSEIINNIPAAVGIMGDVSKIITRKDIPAVEPKVVSEKTEEKKNADLEHEKEKNVNILDVLRTKVEKVTVLNQNKEEPLIQHREIRSVDNIDRENKNELEELQEAKKQSQIKIVEFKEAVIEESPKEANEQKIEATQKSEDSCDKDSKVVEAKKQIDLSTEKPALKMITRLSDPELNENEYHEQFNNEKDWNSIPLLNANNLQDLPDKKLVRFYGMVQDMFNPEYYYEKYEVVDEVFLERGLMNGKYVYITQLSYKESSTKLKKRSLDSDEQMETQSLNDPQTSANESNKESCVNNENNKSQKPKTVSQEHLLNFPLPERSGKACHVKVYKDTDQIHLNNVIEMVGFLLIDPILTDVAFNEEFDNEMEIETHHPPPLLIPRIHCIKWRKMDYNNPLVNQVSLEETKMVHFYLRSEMLPLGKFTLNISHVPHSDIPDYGKRLYEFIETLVCKSHYLPMSLENMNETAFIPKKDYECNRLTSGLLQLSNNTHLVLDETKLTPGHLNESGVKAVSALADIIKHQKVTYDFNYFPMEFDCDIPILILSEGKSLLPSDFYVILKPDQDHVTTFNEICEAAKHFLKPELLNDLRVYLSLSRHGKYELSFDDVQELIQNDFVKMRQEKTVTANDLHQLLVVARLVCLSEGKTNLDVGCWKRACSLEEERRKRLI